MWDQEAWEQHVKSQRFIWNQEVQDKEWKKALNCLLHTSASFVFCCDLLSHLLRRSTLKKNRFAEDLFYSDNFGKTDFATDWCSLSRTSLFEQFEGDIGWKWLLLMSHTKEHLVKWWRCVWRCRKEGAFITRIILLRCLFVSFLKGSLEGNEYPNERERSNPGLGLFLPQFVANI